jgi:hypothetical protein
MSGGGLQTAQECEQVLLVGRLQTHAIYRSARQLSALNTENGLPMIATDTTEKSGRLKGVVA